MFHQATKLSRSRKGSLYWSDLKCIVTKKFLPCKAVYNYTSIDQTSSEVTGVSGVRTLTKSSASVLSIRDSSLLSFPSSSHVLKQIKRAKMLTGLPSFIVSLMASPQIITITLFLTMYRPLNNDNMKSSLRNKLRQATLNFSLHSDHVIVWSQTLAAVFEANICRSLFELFR